MSFKRLENDAAEKIRFTFDGQEIDARDGDTIASALMLAGVHQLRSADDGSPRGPFCLMGACFECMVVSNGQSIQSCMTQVIDGMQVDRLDLAAAPDFSSASILPGDADENGRDD